MDEDEFLFALPVLTNLKILKKDEEWQSKEELIKNNENFMLVVGNNLHALNTTFSQERPSTNREGKYKK